MADDRILDNEYNPKMPQGSGGFTQYGKEPSGKSDFENHTASNKGRQRLKSFFKGNKGKIFGFTGFGGASVALMFFGTMLSGPMQLIHAGQVIGEVIDTARDITISARLTRNVARMGGAYTKVAQNSRVSMFMRIPARNFEKKLATNGVEIVGDGVFDTIGKNIKITSIEGLETLYKTGGANMKPKELREAISKSVDKIPGNKVYKYIMKKTLNKMYGIGWYQGITRAKAGVLNNTSDSTAIKLEKYIANKQAEKAVKLGKIGGEAAEAAAEVAEKAAKEALDNISNVENGIAKGLRKGVTKVISKGLKAVPIVGTVIGVIIDIAISETVTADKVEAILLEAMIKSGDIATMADNVRNGNIPSEDEAGNYVPQQTYMEMAVAQNLYYEYDAIGGDASMAEGYDCPNINEADYDSESEYKKACANEMLSSAQNTIDSTSSTTKVGSSFFSNAPMDAEFDSTFAVSEKDPEYYRGVPTQVSTSVGHDSLSDSIVNALISAVIIIGPKDIEEMMEEEFDADTLDPANIGGTAMYGARVQQNDLSASEGAGTLTQSEEVSLLRETQTHLAEKQMEKSLFARLFDVEDYHSGIATLSRDANWDLTDSSITTQFANVIRTFAAIPNLVASSFSTYTRAASAANPTPYNYGFNMVAYTPDQIAEEPDYWDAEAFLRESKAGGGQNLDNINTDTLRKCTGAKISSDSDGIRVVWGESETYKVSLSNSSECSSYFNTGANGNTFSSYDANGNEKTFNGEQAVRTVLANYKLLGAYAASVVDEMTDDDLAAAETDRATAERILTQSSADMGIDYSSVKTATSGSGYSDIVTAASDSDQLECFDCVAMVKSVYAKAGRPQPLAGSLGSYAGCGEAGNGGTLAGYNYCSGFEVTSSPVPGDVVVWAGKSGNGTDGHVAIYISEKLVSEGGGNLPCNLLSENWYSAGETPAGYLHYIGGQ